MGAQNYPGILLPVHGNNEILKVFNIFHVEKKKHIYKI